MVALQNPRACFTSWNSQASNMIVKAVPLAYT